MPNINLTSFIDGSYLEVGSAAGGSTYISDKPFNGLGIPSGSTFTSGSKTTSATYVDMNGIWEAIGKYGVKLIAEFTAAQAPYTFADGSTDEFDLTEAFRGKPYNSSVEFIKGFPNLGTTVKSQSNVTAIRFRMEATDTHSGTSTELTSTSYAIQQAANNKYENKVMFVPLEGAVPSTINDLTKMMDSGNYVPSSGLLSYQVPHISGSQLEEYFAIWKFTVYTSKAYSNASQGYSQGTELEGYDIGELASGGLAMCDWQDATYEIDDPNDYGYVKFIWYSGDKTTVDINITNRGGAEGIFRYTINNL